MIRRLFFSIVLAGAMHLMTPSTAAASCGGPGEVPCQHWDWCAWRGAFNECWGGLVLNQPYAGCNSSRLNNWGLVCVPCGGTGQPTCNNAPTCDPRHNAFGFCYKCGGSGEPVCWDAPACDAGYRNVFGFCSYSGFSNEPTTNTTNTTGYPQPGTGPVRGIADVHTHQFSNLGFGGVVFWGAPFDWRGINSALAWCDYTWDFSTRSLFNSPLPPVFSFGYEVHGPKEFQWGGNPISLGTDEGAHNVGGTGPFDGWPKYNTISHQQMYHKWLERAYLGGLRLMVMHAVSNEALCKASKRRDGWNCDDMPAVDRQLQGAKDLEWAIDYMDNGRIDGSGWYRIAYSPQQARQLIRNGKLAVVLGIEVDSLFGCKPGTTCSRAYLQGELDRYYSMGVRHVFPIHQFDNAFGGAAIFRNTLNTGNKVVAGNHFQARDCSAQGYTFNIEPDTAIEVFGLLLGAGELPNQSLYTPLLADCNARGLTDTGRALIEEMIDRKFIIDTDHMSRLMVDDVLTMARTHTPNKYPLISSHTSFFDLDELKTEFSVSDAEFAMFKEIGGMVSAPKPVGCGGTRGYAAKYLHAVEQMKKNDADTFAAVAFSTDFNGFSGETPPRFGNAGCAADPGPALTYPFTGPFGGQFHKQATGDKTFDFNTSGLAHVGLIPDFFADLKTVGVTDAQLDPLYNSAESYIRMWEAIDNSDKMPPPTITANVSGTVGLNGWYTSDVLVTWAYGGATVVSGCATQTISTDTRGLTLECRARNDGGTSASSVVIRRDVTPPTLAQARDLTPARGGWHNTDVRVEFRVIDATSGVAGRATTRVTITAEGANQEASDVFSDEAGNTFTARLGGINVDKTPPRVGFKFASLPDGATTEQAQAEQARWHNEPVTLRVSASDDLSGVDQITPAQLVFSTEGGALHGSATATDIAGNSTTVWSDPVKIDLTRPTIELVSRRPEANAFGWNNTEVTVDWRCDDALSGPAETAVAQRLSTEGGQQSATGTCVDRAGNKATHTQAGISIDLTPPAITRGAAPLPNAAGWNNTDVTVTFSASDRLAGVDGAETVDVVLSADGRNLGASRSFVDRAGNSASSSIDGINLDKTPPAMDLVSRLPAANGYGWNNTDVTVTWRCGDALSGVVAPSIVNVLAGEGGNQSTSGTCGDIAGNTTSLTQGAIRIDKTAPVIQTVAAPAANGFGWNNTDVTVSFECGDALSGVATCSAPVPLKNEGASQGVAGEVVDRAGNRATASTTINIDKTAPESFIRFADASHDIAVFGRDLLSGTQAEAFAPARVVIRRHGDGQQQDDHEDGTEWRTYHVTDRAGNVEIVTIAVARDEDEISARVLTVQYNAGAVRVVGDNRAQFEWSIDRAGALRGLEQEVATGRGRDRRRVKAIFDGRRNQTTIVNEVNGRREKKVTKPGLVLLRLATVNGQVVAEIP
jgi:microsomal dipeptidase-like Zn-dependent dipeptidase